MIPPIASVWRGFGICDCLDLEFYFAVSLVLLGRVALLIIVRIEEIYIDEGDRD
jgi:hypothetical protein